LLWNISSERISGGNVLVNKNGLVLILGASGLSGKHIVTELLRSGYRNISTPSHKELDLSKESETLDYFRAMKPDYVIMAAAKVGGIVSNRSNQTNYLFENLRMQNNVLAAAIEQPVKRFIFLSSSCVYPKDAEQPFKESSLLTGPFEPTNEGYAIAKIAGMKLVEYARDEMGLDGFSLLPCNLYGPGDNYSSLGGHVVASMITKFVMGDSVILFGDGAPKRELLHAADLARVVRFTLENYDGNDGPLNVGSPSEFTVKELADIIQQETGTMDKEVIWNTNFPNGMIRKKLDTSKLDMLGWTPTIPFREGIRDTISWYKATGR
jgi:GDP-L-fucose synthase